CSNHHQPPSASKSEHHHQPHKTKYNKTKNNQRSSQLNGTRRFPDFDVKNIGRHRSTSGAGIGRGQHTALNGANLRKFEYPSKGTPL
ncbi:hypothetical protein, partial [Corynebacterium canis]|uniref:hypothetical protein n=1 Tax=Corynebacterium canis TaxID=679663 RepID=UPI0031EB7C7B